VLARRLLMAGGPGGFTVPEEEMRELAYAENTGGPFSVTATTEAGADTIVTAGAVTLDGATNVVVEWGAASLIPAAVGGAWINMILFDNGSSLGILGGAENQAGATVSASVHTPVHQQRRLAAPAAGSHTYSIRAFVSSGTGTGQINAGAGGAGVDMPAYIRVVTAG
jgi:hypothetical protein